MALDAASNNKNNVPFTVAVGISHSRNILFSIDCMGADPTAAYENEVHSPPCETLKPIVLTHAMSILYKSRSFKSPANTKEACFKVSAGFRKFSRTTDPKHAIIGKTIMLYA